MRQAEVRWPDGGVRVQLHAGASPRLPCRRGRAGLLPELLNSDAREYGGSGQGNFGGVEAEPIAAHGRPHSLALTLPPLAAVFLRRDAE